MVPMLAYMIAQSFQAAIAPLNLTTTEDPPLGGPSALSKGGG